MRLTNPGNSRPQYYDRNPTTSGQTFLNTNGGPTAQTQQWSYTVPANRKAFVEGIKAKIIIRTAASVNGDKGLFIAYVPNGGGTIRVLRELIPTNNVGDKDNEIAGALGMMSAGDVLSCSNYDLSTGDAWFMSCDAKYTEFDA